MRSFTRDICSPPRNMPIRLRGKSLAPAGENGWIKAADEVVIFNTVSGLKYLDVLQKR
jgi:hypothetical protein